MAKLDLPVQHSLSGNHPRRRTPEQKTRRGGGNPHGADVLARIRERREGGDTATPEIDPSVLATRDYVETRGPEEIRAAEETHRREIDTNFGIIQKEQRIKEQKQRMEKFVSEMEKVNPESGYKFNLDKETLREILEHRIDIDDLVKSLVQNGDSIPNTYLRDNPIITEGVPFEQIENFMNSGFTITSVDNVNKRRRYLGNVSEVDPGNEGISLKEFVMKRFVDYVEEMRKVESDKDAEIFRVYGVSRSQFEREGEQEVTRPESEMFANNMDDWEKKKSTRKLFVDIEKELNNTGDLKKIQTMIRESLSASGTNEQNFQEVVLIFPRSVDLENSDGVRKVSRIKATTFENLVQVLAQVLTQQNEINFEPTKIKNKDLWRQNVENATEDAMRAEADLDNETRSLRLRINTLEDEIERRDQEERDLAQRKADAERAKNELENLIRVCTEATEARDRFNGVGGFFRSIGNGAEKTKSQKDLDKAYRALGKKIQEIEDGIYFAEFDEGYLQQAKRFFQRARS